MSYRLIFILTFPVCTSAMEDKKGSCLKKGWWILIEDTWYPLLVSVYIHISPHRHTHRYTDTVTQTDRYTTRRKGGHDSF